MVSHRELLHSFTQPLSDLPLIDLPTEGEPSDDDFAELDAMIAKAQYESPQAKNKAKLQKFQERLAEEGCRAQSFRLKAGVVVWLHIECKCGNKLPLLFQRNMEKWQFGSSIHWKTVEEFDKGLEDGRISNAIIRREVCFCERCTPMVGEVGEFKEIVKGEQER